MKNCPELFSYLTLLHKVRYFSGTAVDVEKEDLTAL